MRWMAKLLQKKFNSRNRQVCSSLNNQECLYIFFVQSAQRYFLCIAETENSTGKCFSNLYCIIFVNIIVHHCHLWWFINHRAIKPPNKSYAHPLHITDHFYLLMQELFHMLMKHLWSMYHYTLCLISFSINR